MKTQNTRPVQHNIFIIYILLLLSLVGSMAWWNWRENSKNPVSPEIITTPTTEKVNQTPILKNNNTVAQPTVPFTAYQKAEQLNSQKNTVPAQLQPKAYLLKIEAEKISLVPQSIAVKKGVSAEVALKHTLNQLFDNNQNTEFTSTIPPGTKLLDLRIDKTGIHVNLSNEFRDGGGSTSMIYRVAQVLYTASSLNPEAKVFLSVEGELLNAENPLGGEGIILAEPLTRQTFVEDFSIN